MSIRLPGHGTDFNQNSEKGTGPNCAQFTSHCSSSVYYMEGISFTRSLLLSQKVKASWPDHTLFSKYFWFCYIIYLAFFFFFPCCSTSSKIYIKEIDFRSFLSSYLWTIECRYNCKFLFHKNRLKVTWSVISFVPSKKLMEFHCFSLLWLQKCCLLLQSTKT